VRTIPKMDKLTSMRLALILARPKSGFVFQTAATKNRFGRFKLLRVMPKYKKEYVDLGADYYEFKYREREIRKLEQKAARLGFQVVPAAA